MFAVLTRTTCALGGNSLLFGNHRYLFSFPQLPRSRPTNSSKHLPVWMHGHDLYPNWETAEVYDLAYGPMLFLLNGIALLINPTIFTSKPTGVLSLNVAGLKKSW